MNPMNELLSTVGPVTDRLRDKKTGMLQLKGGRLGILRQESPLCESSTPLPYSFEMVAQWLLQGPPCIGMRFRECLIDVVGCFATYARISGLPLMG